ncbi:MAG: hypothetical protein ACI4PT_02950 [Candidatus Avoscillospira sp.]
MTANGRLIAAPTPKRFRRGDYQPPGSVPAKQTSFQRTRNARPYGVFLVVFVGAAISRPFSDFSKFFSISATFCVFSRLDL